MKYKFLYELDWAKRSFMKMVKIKINDIYYRHFISKADVSV